VQKTQWCKVSENPDKNLPEGNRRPGLQGAIKAHIALGCSPATCARGNAMDFLWTYWFSFFLLQHLSFLKYLSSHILTVALRRKWLSLFMIKMGVVSSAVQKHIVPTCVISPHIRRIPVSCTNDGSSPFLILKALSSLGCWTSSSTGTLWPIMGRYSSTVLRLSVKDS
jgi:hypothetical protein